ncbi:MAG: Holliday junction resolvase RuvX [Deltaproteobacteria bacterium]|nr:Holliday junction resolvase RuvX [Deltaproteobacteria bacterium]
MRLMGIDLGSKRIGVAKSDAEGWSAHPVTVLNRHGGQRDMQAIAKLVAEHEISEIVLGLPLNMDNSEGKAAAATRRFGDKLRDHLEIPVHLWDERLTTWEAHQILKETQVKKSKHRKLVDQLAATLILKSYLEAQREEAV